MRSVYVCTGIRVFQTWLSHSMAYPRIYNLLSNARALCVCKVPVHCKYMCVCVYDGALLISVYMCYDATIPAYLVTLPRQCHTLRIVSTG